MGTSASISFKQGNFESVALFSNFDGYEFIELAEEYARNLNKKTTPLVGTPLNRRGPDTVLVDFIRHLIKAYDLDEISGCYYLKPTGKDGVNDSCGHVVIELKDFIDLDEVKKRYNLTR